MATTKRLCKVGGEFNGVSPCFFVLSQGVSDSIELWPTDGIAFFQFLPIAVLAYNFHSSVMPSYIEMKVRSPRRYRTAISWAMVICSAQYLVSALAGYLQFGKDTKGNILLNFDYTPLTFVVYMTFMFSVISTYPLVAFSMRIAIYWFAFGKKQMRSIEAWIISTVTYGVALCVALFVEDVSIVFGFTGAIASSLLTLIFPCAVFLKLALPRNYSKGFWGKFEKAACYCIIALGVLVAVLGVVSNVRNLL